MFAATAACSLMLAGGCATSATDKCDNKDRAGECDGEGRSADKSGKLRGRDIAEKGAPVKITGKLKQVGNEWALKADDGKTYDVHFGKESYREEQGVELKEGKTVTIKGFRLDDNIVVCVLRMDGKKTVFRDKDGHPAWGGRGGEHGKGRGK